MLGLAWKPHAAKEMRVFGLADWTAERHRSEWLEGITPSWREVKRLNVRVWLAGAVVLLAYATVALVLGRAADHREITLRTLATMLPMLPATLAAGSITLADVQLEMMLSALPDLDSLVDRLGSVGTLGDDGRSPAGLPARGIVLRGVGFAYPGGESVLRELNLELPAGSSLGLVGVNGAGKSTLVSLLARMREPLSGAIEVDGIPLDQLHAREWQRQVAVVYQDFTRLPLSAAENVGMFGDGRPDPVLLARAAERAGAAETVAALPRRLGHDPGPAIHRGDRPVGRPVATDRAGPCAVCRRGRSRPARARRADVPA